MIYIPGRSLWAYDIETDSYMEINQLRGSSHPLSSIVVKDSLFIFTFEGSVRVDLRRNKVTYDDHFAVKHWSNPSPRCIGRFIYLSCISNAEILRIDISTFECSSFICPFSSHSYCEFQL